MKFLRMVLFKQLHSISWNPLHQHECCTYSSFFHGWKGCPILFQATPGLVSELKMAEGKTWRHWSNKGELHQGYSSFKGCWRMQSGTHIYKNIPLDLPPDNSRIQDNQFKLMITIDYHAVAMLHLLLKGPLSYLCCWHFKLVLQCVI